jgi:phosphatidylethanolamine/phosphatidyl-N-methylethanolamine N-methyltransferase
MLFDQDKLIDRISARPPTEGWLYFRRFLKHPARLASLTPSSQALGRAVAQQVRRSDDEYVVELGCGTGAITRALLAAGVPPERLIAVDVDGELLAVLLIDEMFALMPRGRRFLAYTHRQTSPLPRDELGLEGERLARTLRNLPPASVWGYGRAEKG